jgi:hypothetical protein
MQSFIIHTKIPPQEKYKMQNTHQSELTCKMRYAKSCKLITPVKKYKKCIFMGHPPKPIDNSC